MECDYLYGWIKNKSHGHIGKNLTKNGEARGIAGNAEEEERPFPTAMV